MLCDLMLNFPDPKFWEMFVRELGEFIFRSWEWKGKLLVRKEKILSLAFSEDTYYQK